MLNSVFYKIFSDFKTFLGIKRFYYSLIVVALFSIYTTFEPFIFSRLLSLVDNYYTTEVFVFSEFLSIFLLWTLYIIILLFCSYYIRYSIIDKNALNFYNNSYKKYAIKILHMSYGNYLSKKQGEVYKKFDKGIEVIFWLPFFIFREVIGVFSGIIFALIVLLIINYTMFLAMAIMIPVIIFLGYYFNLKTWEKQKRLEEEYTSIGGYLVDSTTNFGLFKTLSLEKKIGFLISSGYDDILKKQLNISKKWAIADIYTSIIVAIERFIVLGVGLYLLFQGSINLGELFLYFSFIGRIYFPLGGLFSRLRDLQKQIAILDNFYTELDSIEEEELMIGENKEKGNGKIEFKDVCFSYSKGGKEILKNLSFSILPGQKIALVGNTGAGKTSIINLIFRLWDIKKGEILLDEKNILSISKNSIRKNIGIVMQDNSLFNTSIRNNLLYANMQATEEEIQDALKKAKAEFVFTLENGIDTIIGERGLKLSGGEKQRLNIARLFLKNPEILILDEATSALDMITEKEVQKALDTLMKGRTSIIIAHRLSTIQHVDCIFMIEGGKLIEKGNYNELIEKKGKFYKLANPENFII